MDTKFLEFEIETKASKDEDRVIEFIASKEIVDRSGDLVKIKGIKLDQFKKNPVIPWAHMHKGLPVAKGISFRKTGDELRIKAQFPTPEEYSFADTVYKLIKGGYINGVSIGIIPDYKSNEYPDKMIVGGKQVRRVINKSELFEVSIVPIPMNQDALKVEKILSNAINDGIIDDAEATEFKMFNNENKNEEQINTKDIDEILELKAKIAELELMLKEQEIEEEVEDNIYKELYDEFVIETKALSHNSKIADSEPSWSSVNKKNLPFKAFVYDDPKADADKKSTWSYPHHWVSGDNMYLHKGGLNAAWAAANGARSGKKADAAVIEHLQKHRKALGLKDIDGILAEYFGIDENNDDNILDEYID